MSWPAVDEDVGVWTLLGREHHDYCRVISGPLASLVQGSQLRSVDHYDRYLDGSFEDQVADSCPQDLTNP